MTMTELTNPWHGDWKIRLQQKLTLLGFSDLEDFLLAHPGLGYVSLAKILGDANVAAMQLYGEQIRQGLQTGKLRDVAVDCLVRFLNEYIYRGWKNGRHFQHRSASACASWSTLIAAIATSETGIEQRLTSVFDTLVAMPIPAGWLPKDSNDAFVVEAFEKAWPING